jgi:transposase
MQSQGIKVLDWPACSPDLNPMENLWAIVSRRVYANNKRYEAVKALKAAILLEWNGIEDSILKKLIKSMEKGFSSL